MKPSHLAALASLLLGGPGLATSALAQGTAEQRSACMGDAWRLCKAEFTGGVEAITACMKRERDKLGNACRLVMDKSERETQQAAAAKPDSAPTKPDTSAQKTAEEPSVPASPTPTPAPTPSQQAAAPSETPKPPAAATETAQTTVPAASATTAQASNPAAVSQGATAQATTPPATVQKTAKVQAVVARKVAAERTAARRAPRTAVAGAQRSIRPGTERVAAVRPHASDEDEVREADRWMRRLGLGGLSPETMRDVRRFQAFFDVDL